ncbi:ACP S-malonyltransferase [Aestuariibacter sp. AA17]|uniref:Malonyl CoA-acyl carrier protein transacylase n=1 Tax=Fluctibacter corallii TaxID=2984329 RepID=A0ABT3A6G1_9ALTE|nr:ACP S-malonyltransferase [Aestuariibacter sp. AA17]MCV2884277.1 ACP S-malonyltransferase [Aestuariibacter sp. AA17]
MTKKAFVFPGQGSQSVGMLSELAEDHPQVKDTFKEASEVLGYDLWELIQTDEDGKLNQTHITQPALLAASVAVWRVLQEKGVDTPDYLAGHSLGEYSALVCAGVIEFKDAISLVEARGQFMQEAVPSGEGGMYAIIGLDDDKIREICANVEAELGEVVSAVNYNSPGQVVIAGTANASQRAAEQCKEAGAKRALPLSVSAPSHCALMQPAADKLAQRLNALTFATPTIPVINNVDVMALSSQEDIKDALVRQLYSPVRWTETVQSLAEQGVTEMWEIGPGKVLTGLAKRINKSIDAKAINQPSDLG